ncbi:hypothetical protein [Streptomyces noursei]|uniref:hypothetical protein n=1 Tax=Streptomyces noursei TaxID=1971 RepID=UPI000C9B93E8|nr:hypothetical protein [Streptomyces noursei]
MECALLVTRDGFPLTVVGEFTEIQNLHYPALCTGMASLGAGFAQAQGTPAEMQSGTLQLTDRWATVVSAGAGIPEGFEHQIRLDGGNVSTLFGVIARNDTGLISQETMAFEITRTVRRLSEHLVVPVRKSIGSAP